MIKRFFDEGDVGMDAMLIKYRGCDREYLVYDTVKFHGTMQPRAIRSICSHNFALSAAGLMVGPVMQNGSLTMKVYSPEGEEKPMEEAARAAGQRYLQDAGYIKAEEKQPGYAAAIGKIFLSNEFVNKYLRTA